MTSQDAVRLWYRSANKKRSSIGSDDIEEIEVGGRRFLILKCSAAFIEERKMIFGFFVDAGTLRLRYFWHSPSQGSWRAGTGMDLKDHHVTRFQKGLETEYAGGYIFETQLHHELEKLLVDIYQEQEPTAAKMRIDDFMADVFADQTDRAWFASFFGRDMPTTYRQEITYVDVLPTQVQRTIHHALTTGQIGSTLLQEDQHTGMAALRTVCNSRMSVKR